MAKLIVDNNQLANEFFEDARLLGIQSPLQPHKFVWVINRIFGYHFVYQHWGEIRLKSLKRQYEFPVYFCREAQFEVTHFVYVNEDEGKHLLPELKHIDFLWLIKGAIPDEEFISALIRELRKLEQVLLVMELTNEKIKNKEHLVL